MTTTVTGIRQVDVELSGCEEEETRERQREIWDPAAKEDEVETMRWRDEEDEMKKKKKLKTGKEEKKKSRKEERRKKRGRGTVEEKKSKGI